MFVTGATGLVGPWLVKALLDRGATIVALIRDPDRPSELSRSGNDNRIHVVKGAVEEYTTLEETISEQKIDTVFHLASTNLNFGANFSPLPTFDTNIRGTYNLLEACRAHQDQVSRVVVASSREAYGEKPGSGTTRVAHQGRHPYEVSKQCVDLLCQSYRTTYGVGVSTIRCPNIYGGGDLNWNRIVPGTIRSILHGERPIIRTTGSLQRSYLYVLDFVNALLRLAESLTVRAGARMGVTYGFADVNPLSALDLVHKIISLSPCDGIEPLIQNTSSDEITTHHVPATGETLNQLGWEPAYSLEEGLNETMQWYRAYFNQEPAEARQRS